MTCQYKRTETTDCLGRDVSRGENATAICNCVMDDFARDKICRRFFREAELVDIRPKLFCCEDLRQLFHQCVEASGCLAGSFDIRKYPNDGKDVWRNYERVRFRFCPFCGQGLEQR
jgi:hypothetical protein